MVGQEHGCHNNCMRRFIPFSAYRSKGYTHTHFHAPNSMHSESYRLLVNAPRAHIKWPPWQGWGVSETSPAFRLTCDRSRLWRGWYLLVRTPYSAWSSTRGSNVGVAGTQIQVPLNKVTVHTSIDTMTQGTIKRRTAPPPRGGMDHGPSGTHCGIMIFKTVTIFGRYYL